MLDYVELLRELIVVQRLKDDASGAFIIGRRRPGETKTDRQRERSTDDRCLCHGDRGISLSEHE